MDRLVTCPWLVQTQHFWRFGSAAIPYVVRSTIGILSDSYASIRFFSQPVGEDILYNAIKQDVAFTDMPDMLVLLCMC